MRDLFSPINGGGVSEPEEEPEEEIEEPTAGTDPLIIDTGTTDDPDVDLDPEPEPEPEEEPERTAPQRGEPSPAVQEVMDDDAVGTIVETAEDLRDRHIEFLERGPEPEPEPEPEIHPGVARPEDIAEVPEPEPEPEEEPERTAPQRGEPSPAVQEVMDDDAVGTIVETAEDLRDRHIEFLERGPQREQELFERLAPAAIVQAREAEFARLARGQQREQELTESVQQRTLSVTSGITTGVDRLDSVIATGVTVGTRVAPGFAGPAVLATGAVGVIKEIHEQEIFEIRPDPDEFFEEQPVPADPTFDEPEIPAGEVDITEIPVSDPSPPSEVTVSSERGAVDPAIIQVGEAVPTSPTDPTFRDDDVVSPVTPPQPGIEREVEEETTPTSEIFRDELERQERAEETVFDEPTTEIEEAEDTVTEFEFDFTDETVTDVTTEPGTEVGTGVGTGPAAGPGAEVGSPADTGPGVDVGSPVDTGPGVDVGAPTDTGVPTDVGTPTDVGVPTDTGVPTDVGTPTEFAFPTQTVTARGARAPPSVRLPTLDFPTFDSPTPRRRRDEFVRVFEFDVDPDPLGLDIDFDVPDVDINVEF